MKGYLQTRTKKRISLPNTRKERVYFFAKEKISGVFFYWMKKEVLRREKKYLCKNNTFWMFVVRIFFKNVKNYFFMSRFDIDVDVIYTKKEIRAENILTLRHLAENYFDFKNFGQKLFLNFRLF